MDYKIGDTVIHWTHGPGKVVAIEEKLLADVKQVYYVVEVGLIKLWVPTGDVSDGSLRLPLAEEDFKRLLELLKTPGEKLSDNYTKRKFELRNRMQKRKLESLSLLIRDLTHRSQEVTLNPNDMAVLYQAEEFLLDEWVLSVGVSRQLAQMELEALLGTEQPAVSPEQRQRSIEAYKSPHG